MTSIEPAPEPGRFTALRAALDVTAPAGLAARERAVLFVLAHHAGANRLAYPSVERIAREAWISESTAQRALRGLKKARLIEVAADADWARHIPTQYRVLPGVTCDTRGGANDVPPGAADDTRGAGTPGVKTSAENAPPGVKTSAENAPPGVNADTRSVPEIHSRDPKKQIRRGLTVIRGNGQSQTRSMEGVDGARTSASGSTSSASGGPDPPTTRTRSLANANRGRRPARTAGERSGIEDWPNVTRADDDDDVHA